MNRRWILGPVAASIVLFALASCGGDDDSASSSTAAATATATSSGDSEDTNTPKPSATQKKTATPRESDEPTETPPDVDDTTPEIDECALVDPAYLTTATGEEYTTPGEQAGDTCTFTADDGGSTEITVYNISAYGEGSEKDFFELFASIVNADILDDPGEEAYYSEDIGLSILQGKYEIDVFVFDANDTSLRDASFDIGEKAVEAMP